MSAYPQTLNAYCVFGRSAELGVTVAVKRFAATVTVAGTTGPPLAYDKVMAPGIVSPFTAVLKVTRGFVLRPPLPPDWEDSPRSPMGDS